MTKLANIIILTILHSWPAISVVVAADDTTQPNAFWVPGDPPSSPSSTASAPPPLKSAPLATYVPAPSGSPNLSPSWNLAKPALSGVLASPLIYPIPNTDKILTLTSINAPLPPTSTLMCLFLANADILSKTLSMRSDGFIPGGKFSSQYNNGSSDYVVINVQDQVATGQKVTYGTLGIALRALGEFMMAQDSFFQAAFTIVDGSWGQVGYGSVVGSQAVASS